VTAPLQVLVPEGVQSLAGQAFSRSISFLCSQMFMAAVSPLSPV
jgi:hypothetical protein